VRRLIAGIAPERLGAAFRWLLASSWLNNLADGLAIASGPLLVASLTHNAFLIASGALLQWLPPLLFGLWAGVLSDRGNRRLIVVTVEALRAAILVLLCVTIATGTVSVALVLVVLFALATADVFGTNATNTLLPMLVHRDDLAIANARIQTGFITVNQLAGPPIGAALFAVGRIWPFVTESVLVTMGAILVARIVLPGYVRDTAGRAVRHDIAEGVRWVRQHAAIRTLVLTIFIFNITFGAAWSVLVLYASRRLGLGALGFGLITTVSALGGVLGTLSYGWIIRRLSLGNIMRIGLIVETLTHLGLALATTPWVAMPIFFVFGAHAFIWGTTSITVRQRAVPIELQGRVGSVNTVGVFGGLVIGSGVGGLLAQHLGVTAPFWFAFVGSAVFLVLIWGQLRHIVHDEPHPITQTSVESPPSGGQPAGG
jgi:predicted MFS family arabinose efflux permease